jgi:hypothetical protein
VWDRADLGWAREPLAEAVPVAGAGPIAETGLLAEAGLGLALERPELG